MSLRGGTMKSILVGRRLFCFTVLYQQPHVDGLNYELAFQKIPIKHHKSQRWLTSSQRFGSSHWDGQECDAHSDTTDGEEAVSNTLHFDPAIDEES